MADQQASRFTPQNQTTNQRLSSNTVGLVQLSDFRKRRAEVLEQQDREARDALSGTGTSTPDRSQSNTPNASDTGEGLAKPAKKKKKKPVASKLSFGDDDEDEDEAAGGPTITRRADKKKKDADDKDIKTEATGAAGAAAALQDPKKKSKIAANTAVGIVPKAVTKQSMQREAAERERLRKEFLLMQDAVKNTEIAVPFVFYEGTDIPGGVVRVKKGDFAWVCLDKSRKVGANLAAGERVNARRDWARIGVDDLLLVRGSVIIPHHYEFYFFIINRSKGPTGEVLFNYRSEMSLEEAKAVQLESEQIEEKAANAAGGLTTAAALKQAAITSLPGISTLEGYNDDPSLTKVVDRRWYERHKHIYPASTWQEFDPEKDFQGEIRKDTGGNTFFFSK